MKGLATLFPEGVLWKIAEEWMWEAPCSPEEEALVAKAVDKRKREFRAGRHCAHALFKSAGVSCGALLRGVQREPGWPEGWVGSISHTQGICVVAIAPKQRYRSIGLDVEQDSPLGEDILNLICAPKEQDQMDRLKLTAGQHFASLPLTKVVFSAKESIHKTYFPLNHHTLDFLDADVQLSTEPGCFTAKIVKPEPHPAAPIASLQGRYSVSDGYVATFIALA